MALKHHGTVLAGLFALAFTTACAQPRPIPAGTDQSYFGHIEEGEKFGVSIGMSQEEAIRILTLKGLRDDGFGACTYYLEQIVGCAEEDRIHLLRRREFLKDGSIYLRIANGQVAAIAWSFQLVRIDT